MTAYRQVVRGGAMLLPLVLLVVGLSAPVVEPGVSAGIPATITPREGAVIVFLLPLLIVLSAIGVAVAILWKKAKNPLLPHEELIASIQAEEWRQQCQRNPKAPDSTAINSGSSAASRDVPGD